jgi:uncharacterized OB-fold protein
MTTTARFWREIPARYNLIGCRCGNCGREFFPPKPLCPDCHRKSVGKMERRRFDGTGEVVSYTVVHASPREFEMLVPYVIAIIQIAEGVRLTAQVVECDPKDVKIGTRVRAVFRKIDEDGKDGAIHYGYKFVPVY